MSKAEKIIGRVYVDMGFEDERHEFKRAFFIELNNAMREYALSCLDKAAENAKVIEVTYPFASGVATYTDFEVDVDSIASTDNLV